jgi:hypothetical protein
VEGAARVSTALPASCPHTPQIQRALAVSAAVLVRGGRDDDAGRLIIATTRSAAMEAVKGSLESQRRAIYAAAAGSIGSSSSSSSSSSGSASGSSGGSRSSNSFEHLTRSTRIGANSFHNHLPLIWHPSIDAFSADAVREFSTLGSTGRAPPPPTADIDLQHANFLSDPQATTFPLGSAKYGVMYRANSSFGGAVLKRYLGSTTDTAESPPCTLAHNRIGARVSSDEDSLGRYHASQQQLGRKHDVQYHACFVTREQALAVTGGVFAVVRFHEGRLIHLLWDHLLNKDYTTLVVGGSTISPEACSLGGIHCQERRAAILDYFEAIGMTLEEQADIAKDDVNVEDMVSGLIPVLFEYFAKEPTRAQVRKSLLGMLGALDGLDARLDAGRLVNLTNRAIVRGFFEENGVSVAEQLEIAADDKEREDWAELVLPALASGRGVDVTLEQARNALGGVLGSLENLRAGTINKNLIWDYFKREGVDAARMLEIRENKKLFEDFAARVLPVLAAGRSGVNITIDMARGALKNAVGNFHILRRTVQSAVVEAGRASVSFDALAAFKLRKGGGGGGGGAGAGAVRGRG